MNTRKFGGVVVVIGLAAAGATLLNAGQRISQGLSRSFTPLETAQRVEIADPSGRVLLSGTFAVKSSTPKEIEKEALLRGAAGAAGKAEIEVARRDGVATKDEVELTASGLPASTSCTVRIDGAEATTFTTSRSGAIDLKLSRRLGS